MLVFLVHPCPFFLFHPVGMSLTKISLRFSGKYFDIVLNPTTFLPLWKFQMADALLFRVAY